MIGLLARIVGGAVSPLVDQLTAFGASLAKKLALLLVAAISFLVVAAALTLAFGMWIATLAGPIVGVLAVAGLYLVIAIAALALALRSRKTPAHAVEEPETTDEPTRSARVDQFTAPVLDILQRFGFRREQMAVLVGAGLAKQLKPIPLVGLAIVAGFLVGRLWKGWDALMATDAAAALMRMFSGSQQAAREPGDDAESQAAA